MSVFLEILKHPLALHGKVTPSLYEGKAMMRECFVAFDQTGFSSAVEYRYFCLEARCTLFPFDNQSNSALTICRSIENLQNNRGIIELLRILTFGADGLGKSFRFTYRIGFDTQSRWRHCIERIENPKEIISRGQDASRDY